MNAAVTHVKLVSKHMEVQLVPELGAEIQGVLDSQGRNLLFHESWSSPLPAHQGFSYGDASKDWLSSYRGGWQTLIPNSGAPCTVLDTPLHLHGEASRAEWEWEWVEEPRSLRLRTALRLPMTVERVVELDPHRPCFSIRDDIRNDAPFQVPFLYGHHPAFGPPLTASGARIDLPEGCVVHVDADFDGEFCDLQRGFVGDWPHVPSRRGRLVDLSTVPDAVVDRLCYVSMSEGWLAIRQPVSGFGLALAWERELCPALWFWQDTGSHRFPLYGRSRITALEPQTQFPPHGLEQAITRGECHFLAPGESRSTELVCLLFQADERRVAGVSRAAGVEVR